MIEACRRLLIAVGISATACAWFYLPPVLVATLADFGPAHAQLVRAAGNGPAPTLDGVAAEEAGKYLRRAGGPYWKALVDELRRSADAAKPKEPRRPLQNLGSVLAPDDPDFAAIQAQAREITDRDPLRNPWMVMPAGDPTRDAVLAQAREIRAGGWSTPDFYVAVPGAAGTDYVAIRYDDRPAAREPAPPGLYPFRHWAWLALALTMAAYILLPWPRTDAATVCFDRAPAVWLIDLAGSICLGAVSGFVLWLSDSTDPGSVAWAVGLVLALALPWFLWASRNAAYGIRIDADRLRVQTWRGSEEWVLADIRAVTPLVVRGVRSGVVLTDASGERLPLDWTGRMRFALILDALRAAGLTWPNWSGPETTTS